MLDWPVYFQANVVMQVLFAGGCVGEASWLVGRRFKPPGLTLGVWAGPWPLVQPAMSEFMCWGWRENAILSGFRT